LWNLGLCCLFDTIFVRFSTEIKFSSPILNKSEIPQDRRQAKFDLGVAVTVDIALKPGMLLVKIFP
jgi:hypothetical protein